MIFFNLKNIECSIALCLIAQRQRCCPENPWSMQSPELVTALKRHAPSKKILWCVIWRWRLQVLENPWFLRLRIYIYIDSQRDKVVTMVTAFRSRLVVSKNRILKGVRGLGLQLLSEVSSFVPLATMQSVLTVWTSNLPVPGGYILQSQSSGSDAATAFVPRATCSSYSALCRLPRLPLPEAPAQSDAKFIAHQGISFSVGIVSLGECAEPDKNVLGTSTVTVCCVTILFQKVGW